VWDVWAVGGRKGSQGVESTLLLGIPMTRCEAENAEARDTSMLRLTGFKSESRLESLDIIARSTTSVIEIWALPQNLHLDKRSRKVSRPLAVYYSTMHTSSASSFPPPSCPPYLLKRFL
jgi:hypothetical protein